MMITEIGHFALILALVVAALQTVLPLWGAEARDARAMAAAGPAALAQFGLAAVAFAALTHAYLTSDFSVQNVFQNSHSAKPLLYKFSGVWGNHEGSMLLWILMLSFLGALVAVFGGNLPQTLRARVLGVQALIALGFLAFTIFTSNPFERMDPVPLDGRDLNPLLQDPGLAFHPPFLYLGYVGFSVAFSFAVAALLEGRVDPAWARWVRPWTLLAWSSLTLGIAMGSWWAYYELGWGGYWFWDPVENASLMPWLAGTALLHSAIVVEKRDTLKVWTILMAIVAFSTSLLGTFLVRSGVLTSVHAFANDPERGVYLLGLCVILTGGAFTLFAMRAPAMKSGGVFQPVSREAALIINNLILSAILFTVLAGTFWPTVAELAFGEQISVGAPYFNAVAIPMTALLLLFMSAGSLSPWKRADLAGVLQRLSWAGGAAFLAGLYAFWRATDAPVMAGLAAAMGVWAMGGVLTDLAGRIKLFRLPLSGSLKRAGGLPRAFWGGALAHFGVGVIILGMAGTSLWVSEKILEMRPGETTDIAGFDLRFDGVVNRRIANYEAETGRFALIKEGRQVAELLPERRWYPVAEQQTTEASIIIRWAHDVYIAIGDPRGADNQGRVVRVYHHPLVMFLWSGSLLMAFGGVVSLTDRRYRVGAPAKAKARAPAGGPTPAPAE